MNLYEATRNDLIKKSKSSIKGKERFNRRNKSRIQNTVKAMNSIDMNRLFKEDILTINLPVQGETDNYTIGKVGYTDKSYLWVDASEITMSIITEKKKK